MKKNLLRKITGLVAIAALLSTGMVTNTYAADTVAPVLTNVVAAGQQIDGNDVNFAVAVAASDNQSGIEHITLAFENRATTKKAALVLRKKDFVNGVYFGNLTINRYEQDGTYYLRQVKLVDYAGNIVNYGTAEDKQDDDLLLPCSVSIVKQTGTSQADDTAPVLLNIAVSPNAGDDDTEFVVTAIAADNASGIDSVKARFLNQNGNGITVKLDWNGSSFSGVIKKGATKAGSTYQLNRVVIKDGAGNRGEFNADNGLLAVRPVFTVQ